MKTSLGLPFVLPLALAACSGGAPQYTEVRSNQERITSPDVPADQISAAAQSERDFGVAVYGQIAKSPGNVFLSPHSIDEALTMLYAGAATTTASAMHQTLDLTLPDAELHPAMNALDLALESRGQGQSGVNGQPFSLKVANALWGQQGSPSSSPSSTRSRSTTARACRRSISSTTPPRRPTPSTTGSRRTRTTRSRTCSSPA